MKRRIVSLMMVLCMMVSLFPASAFADEGTTLNPEMESAIDNEVTSVDALGAFTEPQEPEVPVHEHVYIPTVTEPTCTMQGYATYTCVCGDSYVADYTDALNHPQVIEVPEIPATETSTGTTSGTKCALCGQILSGCEVIPMLKPSPAGDQLPAAAPEATQQTVLPVTDPVSENEQDQNVHPVTQNAPDDAVSDEKVTIVFEIDPADAIITVYSKNELGEITEYDPEEDGAYMLSPGEYYYSLQADGYTSIEEERLEVTVSEEPVTITAVLALITEEEALQAEKQELEAQIEEETERRDAKEAVVASGICGANVTWLLDDKSALTISGSGRMDNYTQLTTPFKNYRDQIKTVSIENNVTSIGAYAFIECSSLTSIVIPESVTGIGESAFNGCSSLKSIVIPGSVMSIGESAFNGCSSLTSAGPIESGCDYEFGWTEQIPSDAFSNCSNITKIRMPSTINSIGAAAFSGCAKLSFISIPSSVTSIENSTFRKCSSLISITIPDGVENIGAFAFGDCSSLSAIQIPSGVNSIGVGAFSGCSSIQNIVIPEGVSTIENECFQSCNRLKSIQLPSGLIHIGEKAFNSCSSLKSIDIPEGVVDLGYMAFGYCRALEKIVIPNSLRSFQTHNKWDEYASVFVACDKLVSAGPVGSGYSIQFAWDNEIPDYAFYYCINLKKVDLGQPEKIGEGAFIGCPISSIFLPNSVRSIGANAFSQTNLQSVSLSKSIEHIARGAFNYASSFNSIYYCGTQDEWNQITIDDDNSKLLSAKLFTDHENHPYELRNEVPSSCMKEGYSGDKYCTVCGELIEQGSVEEKAEHTPGSDVQENVIPATATGAGSYDVVSYCQVCGEELSREKKITYTFAKGECGANLTWELDLYGLLTISGNGSMFSYPLYDRDYQGDVPWKEYSDIIKHVELTDGVTSIGEYAFSDCINLESVSIPAGLTDIGYDSFSGCAALTDVYYSGTPNQWCNINNSGLEPLNSATLHFTKCGENLAWSLDEEGTLTITGTGLMDDFYNAEWSDQQYLAPWYRDREKITSVVLTDGVTHIGDYAFQNCTNLKTVTMPKSVTSIGENVALNSGLTDVYYEGTQEEIAGITLGENSETMQQVIVRCSDGIYGYSGTWGDNLTWRLEENGVFTLSGTGEMFDMSTRTGSPWNWNETVYPWYFYRDRIKKLVVEPGVTSISPYAFRYSAVEAAVLPEGLTKISRNAFHNCQNLRTVNFPNTLKTIEEYAFIWSGVSSFTIPASVTRIGDGALCTWNLSRITVNAANPNFVTDGNGILYAVNHAARVSVAQNSTVSFDNSYTLLCVPMSLSGNLTLDRNVEVIGDDAFASHRNLTSITMPASLKGIGVYQFQGCQLNYIRFLGDAPAIGYNTFAYIEKDLTCYYDSSKRWPTDAFKNYGASETGRYVSWKAYTSGLTLSTNDMTITCGESKTITATGNGSNSVRWQSSNPDTVEVSQTGVVTGKKLGRATITATAGNFTESCTVRVLFSDVQDPSQFYYDYVYEMANRGIVGGFDDGSFRPNNNCNRAAVVTFLWRLAGKPEPSTLASFSDMTGNSDFNMAISWAAEQGITTGWSDNTFRPWDTCNRAAIVTFLWRFAGRPEPAQMATFNDMTGNSDFDKAISWAAENGITTGWSDNTFRPWNTCLRLAVVSFLGRYDAL